MVRDIGKLVAKVKRYNPQADTALIKRAYERAKALHAGQFRESGDEFIQHPLGVADILADLGMDTATIVAALLHDVVEDTAADLSDVRKQFGQEIADLIDGVTKLGRIKFRSAEEHQSENMRKMLFAMSRDLRVIVIKLADRLHNMQTLEHLPRDKQKLKALETLEIYAPIAHRLGMTQLKSELEDLAFRTMEPKQYAEVARMVAERKEERESYVRRVVRRLNKELKANELKVQVSGRPKHLYSIYRKMIQKGKEFNEIHDLVAIRLLVDSEQDCYAALGAIHAIWKPVPGRFKDYIAMPKTNMYQALHTTVIGPMGRPLEIQIRTPGMHRKAEYGIAAHWRYKETSRPDEGFDKHIAWLRQTMEMQSEVQDPGEFMESLKIDLFQEEVFVFTPKGDVRGLPNGSTPIDFAYAIHTDVGNSCIGAKVNRQIVPLEYKLQMGDIVAILTSKTAGGPSKDWLAIARTSRARNKIRQWFSRESHDDSEHVGREELIKALRKHGRKLSGALEPRLLGEVAKHFNFKKGEDLLASIGAGRTSPKQVATRIINELARESVEEPAEGAEILEFPTRRRLPSLGTGVRVRGVEGVLVRLAHCCNPVPRDEIIGFVTHGRGISVHRGDCPNARHLTEDPVRLADVAWYVARPAPFHVETQEEALDRTRHLRDICAVLGVTGVNTLTATVTTTRDHVAIFRFLFEIGNMAHLDSILTTVKKVDSVFEAQRVVPHGGARR